MSNLRIGVINISDRASAGVYEDIPGKAAVALLESWIKTEWLPIYAVVPDDQDVIEQTLMRFADEENCSLIITTALHRGISHLRQRKVCAKKCYPVLENSCEQHL